MAANKIDLISLNNKRKTVLASTENESYRAFAFSLSRNRRAKRSLIEPPVRTAVRRDFFSQRTDPLAYLYAHLGCYTRWSAVRKTTSDSLIPHPEIGLSDWKFTEQLSKSRGKEIEREDSGLFEQTVIDRAAKNWNRWRGLYFCRDWLEISGYFCEFLANSDKLRLKWMARLWTCIFVDSSS